MCYVENNSPIQIDVDDKTSIEKQYLVLILTASAPVLKENDVSVYLLLLLFNFLKNRHISYEYNYYLYYAANAIILHIL